MHFADLAQRLEQADHRITGQLVEDVLALFAAGHQPGLAQFLQMLRRVGNGDARHRGELIDAALALREQFEEFEPRTARQRGADAGELLEKFAFRVLHGFLHGLLH